MKVCFSNSKENGPKSSGFTLLEVMISVLIFGFLMVYVSQLMHMEFKLFDTTSKQNDIDHNSRAAMMHILDEIRLNPNAVKDKYGSSPPPVKKYYYSGDPDGSNVGVKYYFQDTDNTDVTCSLINLNPGNLDPVSLPGPVIYFKNSKLWYRDVDNRDKVISDQIQSINLATDPDTDRILKIEITAVDNSKLISWIRLY